MAIHIGTSGYSFPFWKSRTDLDTFYPSSLTSSKYLDYYTKYLSMVEINATFYGRQSPETVKKWKMQTPDHFRFIVKMSRWVTHNKRLIDFDYIFEDFWFNRMELLGEKCLGVLVQLPPTFNNTAINRNRLDKMGSYISGLYQSGRLSRNVAICLEFRNHSMFTDDIYKILKKHDLVLVNVQMDNSQGIYNPLCESMSNGSKMKVTNRKFIYIRLHGTWSHVQYQGGYTNKYLTKLANLAYSLEKRGLQVLIAFNNTDSYVGQFPIPFMNGKLMFYRRPGKPNLPHAIDNAIVLNTFLEHYGPIP